MARFSISCVALIFAVLGLCSAVPVTNKDQEPNAKAKLKLTSHQASIPSPNILDEFTDAISPREGPEEPKDGDETNPEGSSKPIPDESLESPEELFPEESGSPEESANPSDAFDSDDNLDDSSPEPSSENEDTCFPASATVRLQDGRTKRMDELELGDKVMVGNNQYSDIFVFTHKLGNVTNKFVQINTQSGNVLQLTPGHYLYVNDKLAPAESVMVGDRLFLADGSTSRVTSLLCTFLKGLYNPQTVQGDIVVNGIRASTYTKTVHPTVAHALLAPLRVVYERLGLSTSAVDNGAGSFARLIPEAARAK